jgi:uncharacterized protein YicC (UPF0701 family)
MLALTLLSERSTLDEELDRLKLEVWFVVILALMLLRDRSTLEEEFERLRLDV